MNKKLERQSVTAKQQADKQMKTKPLHHRVTRPDELFGVLGPIDHLWWDR